MAEGTEAECALAGDPASPRLRKPRGHAYLCLLDCPQQPTTRGLGTPNAPAADQVNKWWDGHRAEHHLMRMDDTAPWSGSREPRIERKKRRGATPWLRVRQPRDGEDSSVASDVGAVITLGGRRRRGAAVLRRCRAEECGSWTSLVPHCRDVCPLGRAAPTCEALSAAASRVAARYLPSDGVKPDLSSPHKLF